MPNFNFAELFTIITKNKPPIIGATCAFDAKIYKNVGEVFAVSVLLIKNKKNFQIFDFSLALPSLLVEFSPKSFLS
jgi:hypothetical protein